MSVKSYSEFKKRALLAKQRMKMGYWQQINEEKLQFVCASEDEDEKHRNFSKLQKARINREILFASNCSQTRRDEMMYKKVCDILDQNEDTTSPIGQMIDKDVYTKLDDCGKQRYVLELAKVFREMSERYYFERQNKSY